MEEIIQVEIRKANTTDGHLHRKLLDPKLVFYFIENYNQAHYVEDDLCKSQRATYWVDVFLKNGSLETFVVCGSCIKGNNGNCFQFESKNYLDKLWNHISIESKSLPINTQK